MLCSADSGPNAILSAFNLGCQPYQISMAILKRQSQIHLNELTVFAINIRWVVLIIRLTFSYLLSK